MEKRDALQLATKDYSQAPGHQLQEDKEPPEKLGSNLAPNSVTPSTAPSIE